MHASYISLMYVPPPKTGRTMINANFVVQLLPQYCPSHHTSPLHRRNRVRAIDERWEEVNVRATNTLENIKEDDLDERDPGRKRRGSNPVIDKRREAGT